MIKVVSLLLVVVFVLAFAEYESRVVGQKADEPHPEGTVARVEYCDYEDGWNLIMPYRGDYDGDPYLNDGQITNIWRHEDYPGYIVIYHQVHESSPRYTGEEEEILGSWEVVTIYGGQYDRSDSGKQLFLTAFFKV